MELPPRRTLFYSDKRGARSAYEERPPHSDTRQGWLEEEGEARSRDGWTGKQFPLVLMVFGVVRIESRRVQCTSEFTGLRVSIFLNFWAGEQKAPPYLRDGSPPSRLGQ